MVTTSWSHEVSKLLIPYNQNKNKNQNGKQDKKLYKDHNTKIKK